MGIKESAQNLSSSIKSTNEFKELMRTKKMIEKDPVVKNQLIDFNKKLSHIYFTNKNPNAIKSEVEKLSKNYGNLTQRTDVKQYLKASDAFNQMMYQINQYTNELIQKDIMLK